MKTLACVLLVWVSGLQADQGADRIAIGRVVAALNDIQVSSHKSRAACGLFTNQALAEMDSRQDGGASLASLSRTPLSEVSSPHVSVERIRFVTPDVALVEAANTQFGSLILVRKTPVFLVMTRETAGWRIASLRSAGGRPAIL